MVTALLGAGTIRAPLIASKIGLLKMPAGNGAIFVALDRGYFTAEGLSVDLTFFDGALPIAVATVSGDVDVGSTGPHRRALQPRGARRAARVVAAQAPMCPASRTIPSSSRAAPSRTDLKAYKDLGGRTIGITTIGGSPQYCIVLLEREIRFRSQRRAFLPLQSVTNIVSAITGNQADAGVGPARRYYRWYSAATPSCWAMSATRSPINSARSSSRLRPPTIAAIC